MEPTRELVDALYRDKVRAARRMSVARRVEVTCELIDLCRAQMWEVAARRLPNGNIEERREFVQRMIRAQRAMEDHPPRPPGPEPPA